MSPLDLGGLFLLGLVGSTHCVAMCGAFVLCVDRRGTRSATPAYQLGRLGAYAVLGAVAATLGSGLRAEIPPAFGRVMLVTAGLLMIALGLAQTGLIRVPSTAPGRLRRTLSRLLGGASPLAPLGLGLFTGLLPCPMLYAAVLRAAVAGSWGEGALAMTAFWAGTLPAMAGISALDGWLGRHGRRWWPRMAVLLTVLLGGITIYGGMAAGAGAEASCAHCKS